MWRHRGLPHYLAIQGARLGLPKVLTDDARYNQQGKRISTLLAQLSDRLINLPRDADNQPVIFAAERKQIEGTLDQCERDLGKLHALAATAQAMIDEARPAFGLPVVQRPMRVVCDFDGPIEAEPIGDGQSNGSAHARPVMPKAKAKA